MRPKEFFRRPSTVAFLAFTGLYAACMAFVFWGTWSLDKAPVEPDNPTKYAINDCANWFADMCAGGRFIPSDLMHAIGGMYFWQELQYALAAYLAALGVAFYLRGRRLSPLASYGGGAAFGLMGYCFTLFSAGHLGWFIWLMYGPFAFGLVDRCVRKGRWRNWAMLGAVLAWSSAQQPDMWLLFTVLAFAYGVFKIAREFGRIRLARVFAGVGVCISVSLAVGAPQYGKALFQDLAGREKQMADVAGKGKGADGKADVSRDDRWVFCTNWSLPPEDTLEFVAAEVHGGSNDPRVSPKNPYRGRLGQQFLVPPGRGGRHPVTGEMVKPGERIWVPYRQHSLYFGLLTAIFAIAGVVGWWRAKREPRASSPEPCPDYSDMPFWIVAAVVVYLCALGGFTPFYRLVFAMPFGDAIRCPVKFVHLLELCAAVLAGHGIAWLQERFGASRAWVAAVLAVLAAANVLDLARVDRKYLAVEDVSFYRAANDAAADAVRLGGGKVFVAMTREEGVQAVRESMRLHLAEADDDVAAREARFLLASGMALRDDKTLGERMRGGELVPAGFYSLSARQGIRKTSQDAAALVLLQAKDVPPPAPKAPPSPSRLAQALTMISIATTLCVAAAGAAGLLHPALAIRRDFL